MTTSFTARITGRVQGVGFRAWTKAEAEALGLSGWVRNEADGAVVAHVSGEAGAVERMLDRLRDGPPAARVDGVETAPSDDATGPFEIRH